MAACQVGYVSATLQWGKLSTHASSSCLLQAPPCVIICMAVDIHQPGSESIKYKMQGSRHLTSSNSAACGIILCQLCTMDVSIFTIEMQVSSCLVKTMHDVHHSKYCETSNSISQSTFIFTCRINQIAKYYTAIIPFLLHRLACLPDPTGVQLTIFKTCIRI